MRQGSPNPKADQLDLLVGEGLDLHAAYQDRTEGNTLTEQRDGQCRVVTDLALRLPANRILCMRFSREVVDVDGLPVDDGAPLMMTPWAKSLSASSGSTRIV